MPHSEFLFDPADLQPVVKYEKLFQNLPMLQENIPKTGRRPVSKNSILKALIYKSLRRFPYLADLTFELNNNPSVSKALGFYPLAPAPSIERFSSFLHDTNHHELCSIHKQLVQELIKAGYEGSLDNLLDMLNNIRLGTMLEESKKSGKPKATYMLEEMTEAEKKIMIALGVENAHNKRPMIMNVGIYK